MGGPGAGLAVSIRRLGPGDGNVLALLAQDDARFDIEHRGGPRPALTPADAGAYLADPHVVHWTAWAGGSVVGFLLAHVLPMRREPARELLLYEIGVRSDWRRRGVGRQLVSAMTGWMRAEDVVTAWVLADNPGALRFYEACGFRRGTARAGYLELQRSE